jgi:hypothetical protein
MNPSLPTAIGGSTEAAHTPGPWVVRTLENFGFNVVHYKGGDRFDIVRVAKCAEEADARLIAAVPELFEAVLQYRDDLKYPLDAESAERRREWVEALVAKALGQ